MRNEQSKAQHMLARAIYPPQMSNMLRPLILSFFALSFLCLFFINFAYAQEVEIKLPATEEERAAAITSCDNGDGKKCYEIAFVYDESENVAEDDEKAALYYDKGCALDYLPACVNASFLYGSGEELPQDIGKAKGYLEKACGLDDGAGCDLLGFLILQHDDNGKEIHFPILKKPVHWVMAMAVST